MPTVPSNTKCSFLGCTNAKTKFSSSCVLHGGKEQIRYNDSEKRKTFNSAYQTKQWKTFRQIKLSKEPLCASCLVRGIVTVATEVDHVFPWSKLNKASFMHNIFQSLCKSCHIMKTTLEQKDVIMYYKDKEMQYSIKDYSYIVLNEKQ